MLNYNCVKINSLGLIHNYNCVKINSLGIT